MRWYVSKRLYAVHPLFLLYIWGWCSISWLRESNTPATLSLPLSWVVFLLAWWAKSAQQGMRPGTDVVQGKRQDQVLKAMGSRRKPTATPAQLSQGMSPQAPHFCASSEFKPQKSRGSDKCFHPDVPVSSPKWWIPCNAECSCGLACGMHCSTTHILRPTVVERSHTGSLEKIKAGRVVYLAVKTYIRELKDFNECARATQRQRWWRG